MFVTVTPNPSMDRILEISSFQKGELHRVKRSSVFPSGKGLNVAVALGLLGEEAKATGFLGGITGDAIRSIKKDITQDFICITGETRTNIKLQEEGVTTEINELGPLVSKEEEEALEEKIVELCSEASFLVLSGSLPPGMSLDFYGRVQRRVKRAKKELKVALDTSGEALSEGIKEAPYLLKPNLFELSSLFQTPMESLGKAKEYCHRLCLEGVFLVCLSLGAKGLLLVSKEETLRVVVPSMEVKSTVGCGDTLLAFFLSSLSQGKSLREAALEGAAGGLAASLYEGSGLHSLEHLPRMRSVVSNIKFQPEEPL